MKVFGKTSQKTGCLTVYLKAEKMKYRHTFLWPLTVLMPAVCTLLSAMLTYNYFAMDGYNWWYMSMLPGFLSIICGLIGGMDLKKKNRTIWALPADMGKIWDAKILLSAMAVGIATFVLMVFVLLGAVIMEKGLSVTFTNPPSVGNQFLAAFFIWITSLWQIPFCVFLAQKTGPLLMIMINLVFSQIFGALISLKGCFFLVPYGITPRVMCPILNTLPNGLPAEPGQITYAPELMSVSATAIGVVVSLLWFEGFWYFGRKWFKRQVERR